QAARCDQRLDDAAARAAVVPLRPRILHRAFDRGSPAYPLGLRPRHWQRQAPFSVPTVPLKGSRVFSMVNAQLRPDLSPVKRRNGFVASYRYWRRAILVMALIRRLAAILAADVAGYSRLMGADEEGTHERLQTHLGELVNPKIAEHRGRIVKNTGDGLLAEFA